MASNKICHPSLPMLKVYIFRAVQ